MQRWPRCGDSMQTKEANLPTSLPPVSPRLWSCRWHGCDAGMHWPTGSCQSLKKPSIHISAPVIPDTAPPATHKLSAGCTVSFSMPDKLTQILKSSKNKSQLFRRNKQGEKPNTVSLKYTFDIQNTKYSILDHQTCTNLLIFRTMDVFLFFFFGGHNFIYVNID